MTYQWTESLTRALQNNVSENDEFSDLIVQVGDTKYKAHKLVFCNLSKFFAKACKNFKEAETGIVVLKHDDLEILHHMIAWFRTGEYCDGTACRSAKHKTPDPFNSNSPMMENVSNNEDEEIDAELSGSMDNIQLADGTSECPTSGWGTKCHHPIAFDIEMFALADFYDIEALRESIALKFASKLERVLPSYGWGTLATKKKTCLSRDMEQVEEYCDVVRQVYTTTPDRERGLRDITAQESVQRLACIGGYEPFLELLTGVPEFNRDIVHEIGLHLKERRIKVCGKCGSRMRERPCACTEPEISGSNMDGSWHWVLDGQVVVDRNPGEWGPGWGSPS